MITLFYLVCLHVYSVFFDFLFHGFPTGKMPTCHVLSSFRTPRLRFRTWLARHTPGHDAHHKFDDQNVLLLEKL